MPKTWRYPYFHLGGSTPWTIGGLIVGTEIFKLNGDLAEKAYGLSKNVKLTDSAVAKLYRTNYPAGTPASKPPVVFMGDVVSAETYKHGKILSDWASWWMKKWTGGKGNYTMGDMEDSATFTALSRLAEMGLVNTERVMLLRTASNFDQPYPGQTPQESIVADSGGYIPAVVNAYRVGSAVSNQIIKNWNEWK